MPPYVKQLIQALAEEYTVQYYQESLGHTILSDCFVLNNFCIKVDRLEGLDQLSQEDFNILLNAIRDMYVVLKGYTL